MNVQPYMLSNDPCTPLLQWHGMVQRMECISRYFAFCKRLVVHLFGVPAADGDITVKDWQTRAVEPPTDEKEVECVLV